MKPRFVFSTISLAVAIVVSSCAPAVTSATVPTETSAISTTATIAISVPTVTSVVPTQVVLAVATSRGPNLEATDPSTVKLASGQLQLIEFFRFT